MPSSESESGCGGPGDALLRDCFAGGGAARFAAGHGETAGESLCVSARATVRAASSAVAGAVQLDSPVAGRAVASLERKPFCRCLRQRLFGRERRRLGVGHLRLRLGRPRISQGRLLCGSEAAEVHHLAGAPHVCQERADLAFPVVLAHAAVARRVGRRLQRQPLGLRLAHGRLGCACLLSVQLDHRGLFFLEPGASFRVGLGIHGVRRLRDDVFEAVRQV
eukprot:scaffold17222_cov56-Phaeocystis_antarctica.AAC.1